MKNFTHLHVHTVGSLLDGFNKINNLVNRVKELNMTSIAITDHGTLASTYDFQQECLKNNIKPILGIEMYHTHDMNMIMLPIKDRKEIAEIEAIKNNIIIDNKMKKKDRELLLAPYMYDTKGYHLILLAKNQIGWNNLIKISSIANEKGLFNGRGHCDNELLKQYSEGIICTSACMGSMICTAIRNNNIELAEKRVKELYDIFKDDFYLELQPLNSFEQFNINKNLIDIANKYNIKLTVSNDSHYTYYDDWYIHDVLLCIGTNKLLNDTNRMKYDKEFWIRSYEEMIKAFEKQFDNQCINDVDKQVYIQTIEQALYNTNIIADKIDINIKLGSDTLLFPKIEVPKKYTPETWLSYQCWINLYKYLNKNNLFNKRLIYEQRLKEELDIINTKGFASYFLIVQDAIEYGDKNDCPFGPGRGSAAGSLVSFLLGIVKGTDPIEYNLLFSRFLTMDRTSPPDIDSDIDKLNRQKLIMYLDNKYGHDNVCQVGTETKLGVKNGIKDIMRVFEYSFDESNKVTKTLDEIINEPDVSFKSFDSLIETGKEDDTDKYLKFKALEDKYSEVFNIARQLEGIPRNYGVHAGGVLITPSPINDIFPTRFVDGKKVTTWNKDVVEICGGIKLDMLGLKNVSIINLCLKLIKENKDIEITFDDLYNNKSIRNDENVFDTLKTGKSDTVFQMESNLFKGLLKNIEPDNINDLIAITSIARPGPLSANTDKIYANRKKGIENIIYDLGCDDILGDTYGCMLYQEQLMLIAKKVAGFNDNQTDTYLRKSVAKKKRKLIDLCKQWFIYGKPEHDEFGEPIVGGIANGFDEKVLDEFWENIVEGCASYIFNKSHATSYSLLSCITAWLKYYYPNEYFTAVLTLLDTGDKDKLKKQLKSYKELLHNDYKIELLPPDINKSSTTFTSLPKENKILFSLSSIKGVGDKPIKAIIENRPYNTLEDFCNKLNKSKVNKRAGVSLIKAGAFDSLYKDINSNRYYMLNKFHEIRKNKEEVYDINEYDEKKCIAFEKESINMSLTYNEWIDNIKVDDILQLKCTVKNVQTKIDKNGGLMAFVTIEKDECKMSLTVFAKDYIDIMDLLIVNKEIDIYCTASMFNDNMRLTYIANTKRKKKKIKLIK